MGMQDIYKTLFFRAAAFFVITLYMVMPVCAASDPWEVLYGNTDLTDAASPIVTAGGILLNVTNIGPMLGILVSPEDSGFRLQSSDGRSWHWAPGDNFLNTEGDTLPLKSPGIQQGNYLFLDAESLAMLAGLELTVESDSNRLIFKRPEFMVLSSQEETSDGWSSFTIPKPKPIESQKKSALTLSIPLTNPPPSHDRLNIGVGLGYVQHADWGMELTASGKAGGGDTNFSAFLTKGNEGLKLRNIYLLA